MDLFHIIIPFFLLLYFILYQLSCLSSSQFYALLRKGRGHEKNDPVPKKKAGRGRRS